MRLATIAEARDCDRVWTGLDDVVALEEMIAARWLVARVALSAMPDIVLDAGRRLYSLQLRSALRVEKL